MAFKVGDLICNRVTQEEGRIIRIVPTEDDTAFVVCIAASKLWGKRETLWRRSEIKPVSNLRGDRAP